MRLLWRMTPEDKILVRESDYGYRGGKKYEYFSDNTLQKLGESLIVHPAPPNGHLSFWIPLHQNFQSSAMGGVLTEKCYDESFERDPCLCVDDIITLQNAIAEIFKAGSVETIPDDARKTFETLRYKCSGMMKNIGAELHYNLLEDPHFKDFMLNGLTPTFHEVSRFYQSELRAMKDLGLGDPADFTFEKYLNRRKEHMGLIPPSPEMLERLRLAAEAEKRLKEWRESPEYQAERVMAEELEKKYKEKYEQKHGTAPRND